MQSTYLTLHMPDWLPKATAAYRDDGDDESRMRWVLDLARRNIEHETGGPFAAAVFNDAGLVAAGVNRVVPGHCSSAHAEVVTLSLAQQRLATHVLPPDCVLYTSTEPCAMCLGAVCWSGVRRVFSAATGADAEIIGFDEGPKPTDWIAELNARDIQVTAELLRPEGRALLQQYQDLNGEIYNGHNAHRH